MGRPPELNPILIHAERELARVGYTTNSEDELDRGIYRSTMKIMRTFSSVGHSGSSAAYQAQMLYLLMGFKALTELTDTPGEWMEVGPNLYQNVRDSRMFSEDCGKTYYNVDEFRSGWRRKVFGRKGKICTAAKAGEAALTADLS